MSPRDDKPSQHPSSSHPSLRELLGSSSYHAHSPSASTSQQQQIRSPPRTSPTGTTSPPRTKVDQAKAEVESILCSLLSCINNFDFTSWLPILHPDFAAIVEPPDKLNASEYIEHLREVARQSPQRHYHLRNLDTSVDEPRGTAKIFVNLEMSGVYEGVKRHSVGCLRFKFDEGGRWRWVRYESADGLAVCRGDGKGEDECS